MPQALPRARLHRAHLLLHRGVHLLALCWVVQLIASRHFGDLSTMARRWLWLLGWSLHLHVRRSAISHVTLHGINSVRTWVLHRLTSHGLRKIIRDCAADRRDAWHLIRRVPVADGLW